MVDVAFHGHLISCSCVIQVIGGHDCNDTSPIRFLGLSSLIIAEHHRCSWLITCLLRYPFSSIRSIDYFHFRTSSATTKVKHLTTRPQFSIFVPQRYSMKAEKEAINTQRQTRNELRNQFFSFPVVLSHADAPRVESIDCCVPKINTNQDDCERASDGLMSSSHLSVPNLTIHSSGEFLVSTPDLTSAMRQ